MHHEFLEKSRNLRVVVAGYINLNVIDGSAFFISGLSAMLAENPFIDVFVVTANPIERTEVLDELTCYPNLKIIDPFRPNPFCFLSEKAGSRSLSRNEYAEAVFSVYRHAGADALVLRDTLTAREYVSLTGSEDHNLVTYVTGLTTLDTEPEPEIVNALRYLQSSGSRFLCQTSHIQEHLKRLLGGAADTSILPPHVPDPAFACDELLHIPFRAKRYVYTGKFFAAWNVVEIFSAFKAVNRRGLKLHLDVAGDQFRPDPADKYFVNNVKYLLSNTPGLTWHGRVPRSESRNLIASSDVGIGWRASTLDGSSEFSTKILEYGAMGKPAILNPTPVNVSILGADYPLYADSREEFEDLLETLDAEPEKLREAAMRCLEVAEEHSYSRVRPQLVEFLTEKLQIRNSFEESESLIDSFRLADIDIAPIPPNDSHAVVLGETVYLFHDPSRNAQGTVVLQDLKEKQVVHNRVAELLRNQKLIGSPWGEDGIASQVAPTSPSPSGPSNGTPISTVELEKRFNAETRQLRAKLKTTEERLDALRSSRLGSIQVRIWESESIASLPSDAKESTINRMVSSAISTLRPLIRRASRR
ncbi:glycosyltransferase [Corynebacterium sp. HMSC05C01]|uniref:glycosyltransferase family protein n=1 Tax=Corynebacterium sp. HMSC05C01 TaxID=1581113 RepID=UPI00114D01EC|nr:glycosyltransferase [Corynebacterium sp. HMSC05C01]